MRAFEYILSGGKDISGKRVTLGKLHLPSGRLVAVDPATSPHRAAVERKVDPGAYKTWFFLPTDKGVPAFAVIELAKGSAKRWELAGKYAVDAGLGCFMDLDTVPVLAQAEAKAATRKNFVSYYDDVLDAELEDHDGLWTNHVPDRTQPTHNVVVFRTGGGDGVYSSYWGLGQKGNAVAFVTDFDILQVPTSTRFVSAEAKKLVRQAGTLVKKYKYREAVAVLERAGELEPEHVEILRLLAQAHDGLFREGPGAGPHLENAIAAWGKLIEKEPNVAAHYAARATVLSMGGRFAEGAADARSAIALVDREAPEGNWRRIDERAETLRAMGDWKAALELDTSLELARLIQCLSELGKYADVLALAERVHALTKGPRRIAPLANLAIAHYSVGDLASAKAASDVTLADARELLPARRDSFNEWEVNRRETVEHNAAVISSKGDKKKLRIVR